MSSILSHWKRRQRGRRGIHWTDKKPHCTPVRSGEGGGNINKIENSFLPHSLDPSVFTGAHLWHLHQNGTAVTSSVYFQAGPSSFGAISPSDLWSLRIAQSALLHRWARATWSTVLLQNWHSLAHSARSFITVCKTARHWSPVNPPDGPGLCSLKLSLLLSN
jgi:hypothetical protein